MAKLLSTRLILAVQNLRASSAFWIDSLGFSRDFGDDSDGWAWLARGDFRVGLGECANEPAAGTLGDHSYVVYVTVDDVDALHAEFVERRVPIGQPPSTKPWGMREFTVRTPDGHRMTFGAAIQVSSKQ